MIWTHGHLFLSLDLYCCKAHNTHHSPRHPFPLPVPPKAKLEPAAGTALVSMWSLRIKPLLQGELGRTASSLQHSPCFDGRVSRSWSSRTSGPWIPQVGAAISWIEQVQFYLSIMQSQLFYFSKAFLSMLFHHYGVLPHILEIIPYST